MYLFVYSVSSCAHEQIVESSHLGSLFFSQNGPLEFELYDLYIDNEDDSKWLTAKYLHT